MPQTISIILWSITGTAICGSAGFIALSASENNIRKIERLTRNRYIGLFLGWLALLMCVPHAQAIAPDFMLKLLLPLALAIPVIGFFAIDHAASRAVSGTLILCAYNMIHLAFELNAHCTWLFAVCGWLAGAYGIWCSGLPWTWRDVFRKCAANKLFKKICAALFFIAGAIFLVFSGVIFL